MVRGEVRAATLADVQQAQLRCLRAVATFCDEHDLRYFLDGGTLLGAAREGEFIPWDDDLDIAMPRQDFDEFARIAPAGLGPQYRVDPYIPFPAQLKVRIPEILIREDSPLLGIRNSVQPLFIDIFPLEGFRPLPGARWASTHATRVAGIREHAVGYARGLDGAQPALRFGLHVLAAMPRSLTYTLPRAVFVDPAPVGPGSLLGHAFASRLRPMFLPYEEVFPLADIDFEGDVFHAPRNLDRYLTTRYGDWHTPPPQAARDKGRHVASAYFAADPTAD